MTFRLFYKTSTGRMTLLAEKLVQTTPHILMVRPAHFGFNEQTADSNAFQMKDNQYLSSTVQERAKKEFDAFVGVLRANGVNVLVANDTDDPRKPDAIFPNNWVTFHRNGFVITYPMQSPNRRLERQYSILDMIERKFEFQAVFNLEEYELQEQFLEGTGSMVLDRVHQIVYACLSPRTDNDLLDKFCKLAGYRKICFEATDRKRKEIYHTNVMMAMGDQFVVICLDSVRDQEEVMRLRRSFEATNKAILSISHEQMEAYAGNMLQVQNTDGEPLLVMSTQAYESLNPGQISLLEKYSTLVHSDISTIERYGGGSARCMMAEIFLPQKRIS